MSYFVNLFSPETYEAFLDSDRNVSGFRIRQENAAKKIEPGDKFICYMTRLSRWVGVLEVKSNYFIDESPIFYGEDDPFVVRFKVEPTVWLPKEKAIPIHEEHVWNRLSFTKEHDQGTSSWTGKIRSSLTRLDAKDGRFLEELLLSQAQDGETYEVNEAKYQRYVAKRIRRQDKVVSVTVPEDDETEDQDAVTTDEVRKSIRIQALLARIGERMGMKVWLPQQDRSRVLSVWKPKDGVLLDVLPLNYDETTLKTIEQIDVLWLRRRSIIRAFEVEHTTAVYSGILRMADLLALQPNMDIQLHLVAPYERRDKIHQEILRPVFSLLEKGPLAEYCTFISYDSLNELSEHKHIAYLSDSVLDEYAEEAE